MQIYWKGDESEMIKFIRAEYMPNDHNRHMKYFWECAICGEEYITYNAHTKGLCKKCSKEEAQNRKRERDAKAQEKAYQSIKKALMRKGVFSFSNIPRITINGETYYKAKAIETAVYSMFDDLTD